jgi:hypothetical protein
MLDFDDVGFFESWHSTFEEIAIVNCTFANP